ncbi:hypothetical protein [Kitasatospora sp. NPDC090308]|uniref:hypothetical protein n=1 Tax=Kitasatospora sp. NPDC090308 TaxID=3364082 RepID=UPI00382A297D
MFARVFPVPVFAGPLPRGRRALLVAAVALAAAGCGSSGGSPDAAAPAPAPTSAVSPTSAASASPTASVPGSVSVTVTVSGDPSAAGPAGRPADPCTVWTDEQVSAAMGGGSRLLAEGPSTERPWSCTWGSRRSYLSLRLVDDAVFARTTADPAFTSVAVPGVGDGAVLLTRAEDGGDPELLFTVGASHYAIEAVADRAGTGAADAPAEAAAEQSLGKLAAGRLRG